MDLLDPPTLSLGWWNDHHYHHITNQIIRIYIIDQTNETIGSFTLNYFDGQILLASWNVQYPVMAMFSPSWLRKAGFPFRVFFTCIGFYKETKICGSYHPKTRHEWHNGGPVSEGAAPKKTAGARHLTITNLFQNSPSFLTREKPSKINPYSCWVFHR